MGFWHERFPDRYQREQDSLISLGVKFEIDNQLLKGGVISFDCELPAGGKLNLDEPLKLKVVYPDLYPFFRPDVLAPDLDLPRHQNPHGKNLCLLPRDTTAWELDWTIGDLLSSQLKKVLIKGIVTDPNELKEDVEEQAEPVSEYYGNLEFVALFDTSIFKNLDPYNDEAVFLGRIKIGLPNKASFPSSLAVLKLTNPDDGVSLAPKIVSQNYPRNFEGFLYFIPEFISPYDSQFEHKLLAAIKSSGRPFSAPGLSLKMENKFELTGVIGLAFPEEIAPGVKGVGWMFVCLCRKNKKAGTFPLKVLNLNSSGKETRVPKVRPLAGKTVSIIGLGAIGAPAAIELAKNGVSKLKLLDFDFLDPGNTIRWPIGLSEAGEKKTIALANFIQNNYPSTQVEVFNLRLGEPSNGSVESQAEVLKRVLKDTSLILDSSVEGGIHSLVDYESKRTNIPYIIISATTGGFGGVVMRRIPDITQGCHVCLQFWFEDKEHPINFPPEDKTGKAQIAGCGDITFTGSSFDLAEISLAAVRMAVSALCYSEESGYNLLPHDVGILSLVDENGLFDYPKWEMFKLEKHPNCRSCNPPV